MSFLPWIASAAVLLVALIAVLRRAPAVRARRADVPLPAEWAVTARPVFDTDERRVYRLLREALPHHVVLPKLPLVRFCQPTDPQDLRYWYDLLGTSQVAFAVCSANGRVLAAIDLESERPPSRRLAHIKQSVLAACRVRYLRCPAHRLPSLAELQLLVPQGDDPVRSPQPAPAAQAPDAAEHPLTGHAAMLPCAARTALWHDTPLPVGSPFRFGAPAAPADPAPTGP